MNRKLPPALFGILVGLGILVLLKTVVKDTAEQPVPPPKTPLPTTPTPDPEPPPPKPAPNVAPSQSIAKDTIQDNGFQEKWEATQSLSANQQYLTRQQLLTEWITVNPAAAIRAFSTLHGEQRSALVPALAKAWATTAPKDAAQWALQLPDEYSPRALAAVVASWSINDRPAALEYAGTIKGNLYRQETLKSLAQAWDGPPSQAAGWLLGLPDDDAKDKAVLALTTRWSRRSKDAAQAWTQQLPRGQTKDHALLGLSRGIVASDPGKALDYALQISQTSVQGAQVRTIINDYARTCLACHRKGMPGCLRTNLSAIPPAIVPSSMKEKVLQTVRKIHIP